MAPGDPALEELRQAYRAGDLVLFAGPGVSAAAGLPSWGELVQLLGERARARGASAAAIEEIGKLAGAARFVDAITAAKAAIGEAELVALVRQSLDDRRLVADVPEIERAVAALAPKLRAVLTTNLDHLLERAFSGSWPALHRATADMARQRGVILKLHGTLLDADTWVLTRDDYDRAMYADPLLMDAFSALFHACPILFVGYGLADDDFEKLLSRVRALAGGQTPRHFALVAEGAITPYWREVREKAGVRVIGYADADGRSDEVPRILRWLAEPDSVLPALISRVASYGTPVIVPLPPPPDAPYDRRFYVHRADEEKRALAKLATPGAPVVLWGPWLSGKSWTLGHLLEQIQEEDAAAGEHTTVIDVDLEMLLPDPATPDGLLERFAHHLSRAAGVGEDRFEKLARGRHGWSDKLLELMEDHVLLPAARGRVVLVVEKADAVWGLGRVQGTFYKALRRWKERVAYKPSWSSLRLVFLLSTTPLLVLEDPDHADSPFANLTADVIELGDLSPAQAVDLARMHGLDWDRETIERRVTPLVGRSPYLLRVLMYRARIEGVSLDALTRSPEALEGLYGEHLRELGRLLDRDQALKETVLRVLDDPRAEIDEDRYQRLRRAGLLTSATGGEHRIPHQLYESYLRRRWKAKRPAR